MAKTTVTTIISQIKRRADYDVANDTDLDNLLVDIINDSLKKINQLFIDHQILQEFSANDNFKTVEDQAFRDISKAIIVGDKITFTGVAGDKINVNVDGTDYTDIDISGDASIADVVSAINTAVGSTVAFDTTDGFLRIESLTTGASSEVTIADDGAASGAVDRLFSVSAERTESAIDDLDEIVRLTERTNDSTITVIPYAELIARFPDPSANKSQTPTFAARWNDRIYFGPTPNSSIYVYIDYIKRITTLTSASTLPFSDKYDPVLIALARMELASWLDPDNAVRITESRGNADRLIHTLIVGAAKNIGMVQQSESRRSQLPFFAPRKVV